MNETNFLVLGIGNAQYDLIKYLKENTDYEVHSLSNSPDGPGREISDYFSVVDIVNKEDVLEYARDNRISVVYSVGSDVAMPTACWVSEQLGLPSLVTSSIALTCNNKHALREKLQGSYGAVPFQALDSDCEIHSVSFPAIVKPVDSQGQRGVSSVSSLGELKKAREYAVSHSRSSGVIIETKIEGPEISVNCYIDEGKVIFSLVSDREVWSEFDGGVVRKHIIPSSISESAQKNVLRLVEATVEALDIQHGPLYFQIKVDGDTPYLIEVTPRLDGCHMWKLIERSTGINLLKATIDQLTGRVPGIPAVSEAKPGFIEFICQPPGTNFEPPQTSSDHDEVRYYYSTGEAVRRMNGKMEKCGYVIGECKR